MKRSPLVLALLALAACGGKQAPQPPATPPLPPLQLRPFLPALKARAERPPLPESTQRELRDLADIALQLVEADPRTFARAERALLEHPHVAFPLEPALEHADVGVRRRAAWLCGRSGRTALQLPLLLRLKYELDPETVLWVADALQKLGNDTGLGWLDVAMEREATAQQAGTMAIEICRERSVPLPDAPTYLQLQTALRDLLAAWRKTGVGGRPGTTPPPADDVEPRFAAHLATTEGTLLRPVDDARYVTTRSGKLPLALLQATLQAEEPYLRTIALQILGELGPCAREVGPAVLPLLGDPLTGSYAIRTLGEIGATEAIPHLRARLTANDTELRAAATMALGLLGDKDSAKALALLLAHGAESLDVRVGAAFGLLCLGPDAEAEAFLAEREQKGDYHAPTLQRLRERLKSLPR